MKIEQGLWRDDLVEILKERIAEFPNYAWHNITDTICAAKNSDGAWVFYINGRYTK